MPPRTDAHDRPAANPPDAVSLAALVEARYRREMAVSRDLLVHTAADHRIVDRGNRRPAHARLVEGHSLLDPNLRAMAGGLRTSLRRRGRRTRTADGALHLLGPTDD